LDISEALDFAVVVLDPVTLSADALAGSEEAVVFLFATLVAEMSADMALDAAEEFSFGCSGGDSPAWAPSLRPNFSLKGLPTSISSSPRLDTGGRDFHAELCSSGSLFTALVGSTLVLLLLPGTTASTSSFPGRLIFVLRLGSL
jgi:hypothetical protein